MIQSGDCSVHFSKVKGMQLAEIRSALQRRPKNKFSMGLSPEAQEAMQQLAEESKLQQVAKKGKRGSKANVLFADTVQIQGEKPNATALKRPSVSDIFEDSYLDLSYTNHYGELIDGDPEAANQSPRRGHGRRRSSVTKWVTERRGSISTLVSEVDAVESANRIEEGDDAGEEGGFNSDSD